MNATHANNEVKSAEVVNGAERLRSGRAYRPTVDILENAEELVVVADVPGATADGVDVVFEKGTLTLHAKVDERAKPDANFLLREYGVGDYHREFTVGEAIDAEKIRADFRDGVLTLHLPKTPVAKPRKIAVKAG